MTRLILFDIDGTLIDSGEAGSRSLNKAFYDQFDITDAFAGVNMAGKTDIQIVREGLVEHNMPSDDGLIPTIISSYLKNLEVEIHNRRKHLKPGVIDLLSRFKAMDNYWLGLLTGNIAEGARIKLGSFGIHEFFSFGAFGDDHEDRNRLLPIAIEKFRHLTAIPVSYTDCIVIGDTPRDVECSKPFGAFSIAVSTGPYRYDTLLKTEADLVLRDLSDVTGVMSKISFDSFS